MLETCKVCGCKGLWKAGVINSKQRYRCKNCNKNQAETDGRVKYSDEERKHAISLYLDDCGFRRIARILRQIYGALASLSKRNADKPPEIQEFGRLQDEEI